MSGSSSIWLKWQSTSLLAAPAEVPPVPAEGRVFPVKTNTQTNFLDFIESLGHARKPSQLEERRCSCVFLLGYKLPEQRARARCLLFCSCECRRWNLFVLKTRVRTYYRTPLTYSLPSSTVAARRHRLQQDSCSQTT